MIAILIIIAAIVAATFPIWGPYVVMDDDFPGDER